MDKIIITNTPSVFSSKSLENGLFPRLFDENTEGVSFEF
jgi:hypothetical protein